MARFSLLAALLTVSSALAAEGNSMDDKSQVKIASAAQAEHGWKPDEMRVDEAPTLRRGSCSFYEVRHKVKPLSYVANYACLPDGCGRGPQGQGRVVTDSRRLWVWRSAPGGRGGHSLPQRARRGVVSRTRSRTAQ
jgi:hypothetical protein